MTKLLSIEVNNVIKLTSIHGNAIHYQEESKIAFTLLVNSQYLEEPIDLGKWEYFPLTPVPHMLRTPDGFFAKTKKGLYASLTSRGVYGRCINTWKYKPYSGWECPFLYPYKNPDLFGSFCLQFLEHMARKKNFIFSTYYYEDFFMKRQERLRHENSEGDKQILTKPSI